METLLLLANVVAGRAIVAWRVRISPGHARIRSGIAANDRRPARRSGKNRETRTRPVRKQMDEYFVGKRRDFDLALDLRGTDFRKRCWNELLKIPYGETRSYGEIARRSATQKAFAPLGRPTTTIPLRSLFRAIACWREVATWRIRRRSADQGISATAGRCCFS